MIIFICRNYLKILKHRQFRVFIKQDTGNKKRNEKHEVIKIEVKIKMLAINYEIAALCTICT